MKNNKGIKYIKVFKRKKFLNKNTTQENRWAHSLAWWSTGLI